MTDATEPNYVVGAVANGVFRNDYWETTDVTSDLARAQRQAAERRSFDDGEPWAVYRLVRVDSEAGESTL
ncbi:hypothetical protein ACIBQ0_17095 [Nocardia nova]|uniref:hypothetical protein n=1 Tax=Nocardia nova TaxID=37330 RepID=UPI0037BCBAC1